MAGEVRYCKNCRRNIAAANFVIHSAHCERNISLCPACKEPVPRSEMRQHAEEYHVPEPCEFCDEMVEKWKMEDHKTKCLKRPLPCNYCQLECPFNDLEEHEEFCGTRTEKCTTCNSFVQIKDHIEHKKTCQHDPFLFTACGFCHLSFPATLFREHAAACGSQHEECPRCGEDLQVSDRKSHKCKIQSILCHYCDVSIPGDMYVQHYTTCAMQRKSCPKCNASVMNQDKSSHICQIQAQNVNVGTCGVCRLSVPWIDMRDHESFCRLSLVPSDEEQEKPKFEAVPAYQKRQSNFRQSDSRPQKGTKEVPSIQKMKQCPYCKERFPDLIAEGHSEGCGEKPYRCVLCMKTIVLKDKMRHELGDCPMLKDETPDVESSYPLVASGYTGSYEKKLKQCSFCHKKFPQLMFEDHLSSCPERPFQCNLCLKMMPWKNKDRHESSDCAYRNRKNRHFLDTEKDDVKQDAKRSFDYLEKNFTVCLHCQHKIPEAKLAEHVQSCSKGKKTCRFCGMEIWKEEEKSHMNSCIGVNRDNDGFQTAGGKKNKKNKKKEKQTDSNQSHGFRSFLTRTFFPQNKELPTETYFEPDIIQLPCEFCDELYPGDLLIEHQSGCRPDLVSLPNAGRATQDDEEISRPIKTDYSLPPAPIGQRDPRSTGALPKRNRYHPEGGSGIGRGEILRRLSSQKEDLDYYNYPSGVPEHQIRSDVATNQNKTSSIYQDKSSSNKAPEDIEEKNLQTKNSTTAIFNFSSSSNRTSSSHKAKPSMYHNDELDKSRQRYSGSQKTELRAVGAERAEKKGIIQISRETVFDNDYEGKLDTNDLAPEYSRNSDNNNEMKGQFSPKLKYLEGRPNVSFAEESYCGKTREKPRTTCAERLQRLSALESQPNNDNSYITEDDTKNEETFGSDFDPKEPLALSNEDYLSDTMEEFYDAEDTLKAQNVESGDIDKSLDAYLQFLMKDTDISDGTRNEKEDSPSCKCGNKICYCNIINETDAMGNNLSTEQEDNLGNAESPNLRNNNNHNYVTSCEVEEMNININQNQLTSAEVKKGPAKFNQWRSHQLYDSGSE